MSDHQNTSPSASNEANVMMPILVLVGVMTLMLLVLLSGRTVVESPEVASVDGDTTSEVTGEDASETVEEVVEETVAEGELEGATDEGMTLEDVAESDTATGTIRYMAEDVATGQSLFVASCTACHGSNAEGVPGLGKNLVTSEFVQGLTDAELREFIIVGRTPWDPENTTGVAMPARGGNPTLNDESIDQIIAYIRTIGNPELILTTSEARSSVETETESDTTDADTTEDTATETTEDTSADGGDTTEETTTEEPVETTPVEVTIHEFTARETYALSCAGCHGVDGEGVGEWPGILGSDAMSDPEALRSLLITEGFIEPTDNFVHPGLVGYPELSDEQIQEVVDYIMALGQ